MKLLVIEDEPKTANFLKRGFSEAGFVVDVAPDGGAALGLIQALRPMGTLPRTGSLPCSQRTTGFRRYSERSMPAGSTTV